MEGNLGGVFLGSKCLLVEILRRGPVYWVNDDGLPFTFLQDENEQLTYLEIKGPRLNGLQHTSSLTCEYALRVILHSPNPSPPNDDYT